MKNKLGLITLSVASLFSLTLASCGSNNNNKKILDAFNKVVTVAKTLEQDITISNKNMVVATENVVINFENNKKTTTSKVANDLTAETPWTETTNTVDFDSKKAKLSLKENMFSSLDLAETTLKGVVSNDSVLKVFGISSDVIDGDVKIEFTVSSLTDIKVETVELNYVSINGNDVEIVCTYSY